MKKDPGVPPKSGPINLSVIFLQKDFWPFMRVTVHGGKGNDQTFQGLLDHDSELMVNSRNPKCHCGLPVTGETNGGQVISGVLPKSESW